MSNMIENTASSIPTTETIIEIDSENRLINVPEEMKDIAVSGDHVSETLYFKISRFFDNQDFSEHNCIIRVINAGKEYVECNAINVVVTDDYITFAWLIDKNVTRYSGTIEFTIQFETINDTVIEYQWQTTPAQLNILKGIDIENAVTEKDDLLFRWLSKKVDKLQETVNKMEKKMDSIDYLVEQIEILEKKVEYIENNVVYILDEV